MTHLPNKRLQKASNFMSKLILGVATNSNGHYKTRLNGKMAKSYRTWQNMAFDAARNGTANINMSQSYIILKA